jgi:hypothetical protein
MDVLAGALAHRTCAVAQVGLAFPMQGGSMVPADAIIGWVTADDRASVAACNIKVGLGHGQFLSGARCQASVERCPLRAGVASLLPVAWKRIGEGDCIAYHSIPYHLMHATPADCRARTSSAAL